MQHSLRLQVCSCLIHSRNRYWYQVEPVVAHLLDAIKFAADLEGVSQLFIGTNFLRVSRASNVRPYREQLAHLAPLTLKLKPQTHIPERILEVAGL